MRTSTGGPKAPWDHDPGEGGGGKDNIRWFNVLRTYRPSTFVGVWNGRAALGYDTSQTALSALYQGTIDYALAYARHNKQFCKAISEVQTLQFQLAEMAT